MLGRHFHRPGFLPVANISANAESAPLVKPEASTSSAMTLSTRDLPAFCPNSGMPLWASHPRVYLEVVNEAEAMCPYCGTHYRLAADARVHDHHAGTRSLHQHRAHGGARADAASAHTWANGNNYPIPCPDELGNTTLERMTHWLRGERR